MVKKTKTKYRNNTEFRTDNSLEKLKKHQINSSNLGVIIYKALKE